MQRISITATALIAFACVVFPVFVVSAAPTEAEAIVVKGDVTAIAVGAVEPQLVQRGSTVGVGSLIRTAKESGVLMSAFPGSAVRVMEDNEVVLEEADLRKRGETVIGRKVVLDLRKGKVMVAIDKPGKGTIDFTINTPQCVAAARGTVYSTSTTGYSTKIVMLNGTVACTAEGVGGKQVIAVPAGLKLNLMSGEDGVLPDGPMPATEEELKELLEFLKDAAARGLVLSPLGEGPGQPLPLRYLNLAPIITDTLEDPVSP